MHGAARAHGDSHRYRASLGKLTGDTGIAGITCITWITRHTRDTGIIHTLFKHASSLVSSTTLAMSREFSIGTCVFFDYHESLTNIPGIIIEYHRFGGYDIKPTGYDMNVFLDIKGESIRLALPQVEPSPCPQEFYRCGPVEVKLIGYAGRIGVICDEFFDETKLKFKVAYLNDNKFEVISVAVQHIVAYRVIQNKERPIKRTRT